MVKTPRTRHSKTTRDPVTIDPAPGEVARMKADQEEDVAGAGTSDTGETGDTSTSDGRTDEDAPAEGGADFSGPGEEPAEAAARDPEPDATSSTIGPSSPRLSRSGAMSDEDVPDARQSKRGGIWTPLLAGAGGGVLALALAGGLQVAGVMPGAGNRTVADDTAIEARIDAIEGEIAALSQGLDNVSALGERVAASEQNVASLVADLARLREEMAGLGGGNGASTDLGPIEERVTAIEEAIAGLGGAATPEAAFAALDEQIERLMGEIGSAREAQSAATTRLDALERSLGDLASRFEERAEAPGTAVIIAASALKAAIDRGGPFTTELETYASLAPDASEIAELRDMAADGVPTRAQISAESDAAANAMIAAARPDDPQAGILDRLWGSAMGLVQVRPIGMVDGEGVPEIVARIDAAVTSNDYQRAIDEFESLPAEAKAAGETFIAKVRARHGADALIDQALAAALKP